MCYYASKSHVAHIKWNVREERHLNAYFTYFLQVSMFHFSTGCGWRGKGWFLTDLNVKASLGNSNHQMLQLPTARCCHIQEKYMPEITILHIQREHLQSLSVSSYSSIIQPSHCDANMSNLSWNFQAIHSYLCITIFTILKYPMSLDLYQALHNEEKAVSFERSKVAAAILQSNFYNVRFWSVKARFLSHFVSTSVRDKKPGIYHLLINVCIRPSSKSLQKIEHILSYTNILSQVQQKQI